MEAEEEVEEKADQKEEEEKEEEEEECSSGNQAWNPLSFPEWAGVFVPSYQFNRDKLFFKFLENSSFILGCMRKSNR